MPWAITGRDGGTSRGCYAGRNVGIAVGDNPAAVRANRAQLADQLGLAADRVLWLRQVHGTEIVTVKSVGDLRRLAEFPADGAVTNQRGIAVAIQVADCVPVLAVDMTAGVIGGAHAGRAGAQAGIARALLTAMVALGAQPARLDVLLGPAICGQCYEVPAAMAAAVDASLPGSASQTRSGAPALDLRAGLARQLRSLGVTHLRLDERCTREDLGLFSHRRQAPTGRQAALIWQ